MEIGNGIWSVYVHTSPSNKYYVGITSQKPERRWRNGDGYKKHIYFNRAIQKYGWDNFQHEVVASNLTEEEANNFEIALIAALHSDDERFGYNLRSGGCAPYNYHFSDEQKAEMAQKRRIYYDKYGHVCDKAVLQFDKNGDFVGEYRNITSAAKSVGADVTNISRACQGIVLMSHGYFWAFKNDVNDISEYKDIAKSKLAQKKERNNEMGIKRGKPVNLYDLTGIFISSYASASMLSRELGVCPSTIIRACNSQAIIKRLYRCAYA